MVHTDVLPCISKDLIKLSWLESVNVQQKA